MADSNQIEPTPKQLEFITSTAKFTCFSGGFGCVAGETKIYNPSLGISVAVEDIESMFISSYDKGKLVNAIAIKPKKYKKANLYRVQTERDLNIIATRKHRFLTRQGWKRLSELSSYDDLAVYGGFHLQTILEFFLQALLASVRYCLRILLNWIDHCFAYFHLYGLQLHLAKANALTLSPLLVDVPEHILQNSQRDDLDKELTCNHPDHESSLASKNDSSSLVALHEANAVNYIEQRVSELPLEFFPKLFRSPLKIFLLKPILLFFLRFRRGFWTYYHNYTLRWEKIANIGFERRDYYYDLIVPEYHAYLGQGFISHNSGKTFAGCLRALLLSQHPNSFGLIGRSTYPELRDTTRRTFFEVCPPEYYDEAHGGQWKPSDNHLRLVNGSEIIFRHLDTISEKELLSLNLGWFFIDQAEEIGEQVFRILQSRLRLNTVPNRYGFVICNPEPGNWIDNMFRKPVLENKANPNFHFIESASTDNPHLPADYVPMLRETYPEEMVKRFVEGRWDVMENQIYSEYDYKTHVIQPFDIPQGWEKIVAVDHGMVNPTCALWAALDYDGNVFIIDEYYSPGIVSEHAKAIIKKTGEQEISLWLIDPSTQAKTREKEGQMWSVMEEYEDCGLYFTPANNEKLAGINRVKEFLKLQKNRRNPITKEVPSPRLFIFKNCIDLIAEMPQYQWRKLRGLASRNSLEQPRDFNDHAVDALRYIIMSRFPAPSRRSFSDSMILPEHRKNMNLITAKMQDNGDDELGSFYQGGGDIMSMDEMGDDF